MKKYINKLLISLTNYRFIENNHFNHLAQKFYDEPHLDKEFLKICKKLEKIYDRHMIEETNYTAYSTIKNIINDINSHIEKSSILNKENRVSNWQSEKSPNLHTHSKYKELTDKVLYFSKLYLDDMSFEYEQHYISGMWSNILKPGETHSPHTHANNIISGVYYTN